MSSTSRTTSSLLPRALLLLGVLVAACSAAPKTARADTITQTQSYALKATDWSTNLVFNTFNTQLGTLTGAMLTLTEHAQGDAGFEDLSSVAATVTLSLQTQITANVLGENVPDTLVLLNQSTTTSTGFDGKIDFAGTSGKSYSGLTANQTSVVNLLQLPNTGAISYLGSSTFSIPVGAVGVSSAVSNRGNLATSFDSSASITATIVYNYVPVPEPSSLVLISLGGLGFFASLRRRRGLGGLNVVHA